MRGKRHIFAQYILAQFDRWRKRNRPRSAGAVLLRLIEAKSLAAHERAKVRARRHAVLAGLVLGPSVKIRLAPSLRAALPAIRPQRRPPPVVGVDLFGEIALAIAVFDHRGTQRQARRDLAGLPRPTDAESRDRNDPLRQP